MRIDGGKNPPAAFYSTITMERLSRNEAAKILGVTPQTISNLAKRGVLTATKNGQWQYFSREEVESIIPKIDGVRSAENELYQIEKEMRALYHERNNVVEVGRARSKFIKSVGDFSSWNRYRDLVLALYQAVERMEHLDDRLSSKEMKALKMIISLRPTSNISQELGMTSQYIGLVFNRALRRIYRYSRDVAPEMENMRRQLDDARAEIERLKAEKEELVYNQMHKGDLADTKGGALILNIKDLGMSVRATHCLLAAGINTLGDLTKYTRRELMKFRNFGKLSLNEVDRVMAKHGLTLRMTGYDW